MAHLSCYNGLETDVLEFDGYHESEDLLEKRYINIEQTTPNLSRLNPPAILHGTTVSKVNALIKQTLKRTLSLTNPLHFLNLLLPSQYLQLRRERRSKPIRPTAYLDGLRGFAALLVYAIHHQAYSHSGAEDTFENITESAFGFRGNYHFSTFPGIRLFFSGGHFAVALFFVISGYALSTKPLHLIHEGQFEQFAKNVGSGLFRRWLRLYIPVFVTTFLFMTSWHIFGIRSSKYDSIVPEETYLQEIWRWCGKSAAFSYLFSDTIRNPYNLQMWSIPIEFRGSVVVYSSLLALFQCERNVRLGCYGVLMFYFVFVVDGSANAFFLLGTLFCDIDILIAREQLPRILDWTVPRWMYYIPLLLGLYLAGVPTKTYDMDILRENPGWHYLSYLKPEIASNLKQYYFFWAAAMVMFAIPRIRCLKGFFETTFCQYMGKISFGFYLIHGPILFTIGARMYAAVGRHPRGEEASVAGWVDLLPVTSWGPLNLEVNNVVPHFILLPFTLWLGELVTRFIDEPSVRLLQRLFKRCTDVS